MKKSTLNVITLALVLINLVLTVILTFSLVSTNNKTNKLISKVAEIIDLDVAGADTGDKGTSSSSGLDDITYVDVTNNDSKDIMISYTDGGKTHYAIMNVSLGLNTKAKDYESVKTQVESAMSMIDSTLMGVIRGFDSTTPQADMEKAATNAVRELFASDTVYSVSFTQYVVQ